MNLEPSFNKRLKVNEKTCIIEHILEIKPH